MQNRPVTTLFMLMSVDGKISTGAVDELDVDQDFPKLKGVREGLHQYYEIEQTQGLWYLNSGRVQEKMGVNEKEMPDHCWNINFVLLDNHHLTAHGIEYFCALSKDFIIVTSNPDHPAFKVEADNLHILYYEEVNFQRVLEDLYQKFHCDTLTVQSGATLNAEFLRQKLFDYLDIVVAPVLIGGEDTASLIGGKSLMSTDELYKLGILRLEKVEVLEDSYIRLKYKVIG
ncbi:MAG: dihydrofolate reductase family protein [Coprococcus sp.]